LVSETLTNFYGFDTKRVQQLKEEVKKEDSKWRLLFILDSYDELKEEFQYKN